MFNKITLTLITMILLISMVSCINAPSDPPTSPADENESSEGDEYQMLPIISNKVADINLDASADGTTQQLKKGEIVSISLESNPSTGFSWFPYSSNPDILIQMGEAEFQEPTSSETPMVGAPGMETFYFQASETGITTLTIEYKRGWETDVAAEKVFTVTLEVK